MLNFLWRIARAVAFALAAVVFAIEEWGWRPLTEWAARLARWPPLAWLEERIRRAPPRVAICLFLVPALLLFPLKILALWFVHMGHATLGIGVILAAKIVGTALVGRLFILTEPQLVRFAWFARALDWWRTTKQRVHDVLDRAPAWQAFKRLRRRVALWWRRRMRGAR